MHINSGYAEVNGTRLYYETAGTGHPLVLIHGFSLDTRMWDDQFCTFAENYLVIRYDARGFGKSALPGTDSYSHHDDLKALLDLLNISRAHILGLSMGGRIATDFAIAYPQYTASLIAVDSVLHGFVGRTFQTAGILAAAKDNGPVAANLVWLNSELFAAAANNPKVSARLQEIVSDYSGWHWLSNNPWIPLNPSSIEQLGNIRAKTLVIVGEQDIPDFHAMCGVLAQNIPGAIQKVISGAGHMCNMEAPAAFNGIVIDFLAAG